MTATTISRHQQKQRILRNTAANAAAQAATMLSTLVLLPLLVRAFGLSAYGTLALATSVTGYALLLDLGISATLIRMVAARGPLALATHLYGVTFERATAASRSSFTAAAARATT